MILNEERCHCVSLYIPACVCVCYESMHILCVCVCRGVLRFFTLLQNVEGEGNESYGRFMNKVLNDTFLSLT